PLIRSRMSLFVACAAAFAGGLTLLIANGERILEGGRLASANAAPRRTVPASGWEDLDFLLASGARGGFSAGSAEGRALPRLARTADFSLLKTAGIPASDVLELARNVIEGRVALAQGDANKAIERFEQAAGLQETLPYMEPPYWYYPVRQSLAVALMQAGRLDHAEGQFRRALARAPNNGWSYYGLAELYKTRGDAEAARKAEAELAKTWVGDRQLLQLSKL